MFSTLVVPLDGSPLAATALPTAGAIARRSFASIELVMVTSPGLPTLDGELALKQAAADTIADVAHSCRVIESNDVRASLVEAASADGALLCMATHGRTGLTRVVLGSTAEAVTRTVARPVVLVGPHALPPSSFDAVVACIAPSADPDDPLLPAAVDLARTIGARLWLVQIQGQAGADATDVVDSAELHGLAHDLLARGIDVEWEVTHGDVVGDLLRLRAQTGAAMLAVMTHGRRGIARTVLGSVATQLVHTAPCPVLVVPPGSD